MQLNGFRTMLAVPCEGILTAPGNGDHMRRRIRLHGLAQHVMVAMIEYSVFHSLKHSRSLIHLPIYLG